MKSKMVQQQSQGRIKVAQVMFSLEPGGLENGVVNLANGLDRDRFETSIVCLERIGQFAERLRNDVPIVCLTKSEGFSFAVVRSLAGWLRLYQPDLIHTHNLGPLIYAAGARALQPFAWRTPILHGEHGALQGDDLDPRRLRQRRFLYQQCRKIHTVSSMLREHLVELGFSRERIVAILNGVDCERFSPAEDPCEAKQRIGLRPDALVIGSVGRFIASKRHLLLIEAFEMFAERLNVGQPVLLLVGDGGAERESVHARVQASPLRQSIHLVGHQANPAPYYQAMDLMAMPSNSEGLANALLEAMATAVPCLAHPACGASEVITHGYDGMLQAIGSEVELSEAIQSYFADPESIQRLKRNARQTALNKFSLDAMVGGYSCLFREVAFGNAMRSQGRGA